MADDEQQSPWRLAGVGIELAGVIGVMAALGYGFDQWRGTEPWGVLVGSGIGIVGGLYNLIKQVLRINKDR